LIGIVAGAALIFVTLKFNLQKWVIIIATSVAGAAVVFGGFFMMFNPWSKLLENPLKEFFAASPFLLILAIVLAIAGFVVQYRQNRNWTLEAYSNWE
jgi:formate hydrogenlyase subunit 3/multisubunit Na+/H+ antiporter MnhD subunit